MFVYLFVQMLTESVLRLSLNKISFNSNQGNNTS